MKEEQWRSVMRRVRDLSPGQRLRLFRQFPPPMIRAIEEEWRWQRLDGQIEPPAFAGAGPGEWAIWLIMAGRGFGKTRAGAEWVWERAREGPVRIALVAASLDEAARVMIEGESGLIATARCDEAPLWRRARGELLFPSGAIAQTYSGAHPAMLRGPQHHYAWADELAKWERADEAWSNLRLGLRLGERPRAVVTTTPAPSALLRALVEEAGVAITRGRTDDNPHLPESFLEAMFDAYGGTRLGRQELEGVLFDDAPGALWTRETIERRRAARPAADALKRVVIGVDPPASAEGTCGIVACGAGRDGLLYVLADHSIARASPRGWAERVADAAAMWQADRVVAEQNNGGDMVGEVLRGADRALPLTLVSASRGKVARAEPVAMRFETGKALFAGAFPALEDELCGFSGGGEGYRGPGRSPDRADAMIWAMTELLKPEREPRIRMV